MKNTFFILTIAAILWPLSLVAGETLDYRRNSLTTMLVYHPEDEFGIDIFQAFDSLPVPDKYDDHQLPWEGYQQQRGSRSTTQRHWLLQGYLWTCTLLPRTEKERTIHGGPAQQKPNRDMAYSTLVQPAWR